MSSTRVLALYHAALCFVLFRRELAVREVLHTKIRSRVPAPPISYLASFPYAASGIKELPPIRDLALSPTTS